MVSAVVTSSYMKTKSIAHFLVIERLVFCHTPNIAPSHLLSVFVVRCKIPLGHCPLHTHALTALADHKPLRMT